MKKLLFLLLCAVSITTISSAQTSTWERSLAFQDGGEVYPSIDSGWFVANNEAQMGNPTGTRIFKFDKNGSLQKIKEAPFYFVGGGFDYPLVLQDSTGDIYIAGLINHICDVGARPIYGVAKYSANFNLIWNKIVKDTIGNEPVNCKILLDSKNNLILYNSSYLFKLNSATGNIFKVAQIAGLKDSLPYWMNFTLIQNDAALIPTATGITKLDSNNNIVWSKSGGPFNIIRSIKDKIFAVSSSKIVLMDSSGSVRKSYAWNTDYNSIADFAITDGFMYVLGFDASGKNIVGKFDYSLNKMRDTKISEFTNLTSIAYVGGKIALSGTDLSDGNAGGRFFIKTMDTAGTMISSHTDAGVVRIIPGVVKKVVVNQFESYYVLDLDVIVKNHGTTTIDSLSIFTVGSQGFGICGDPTDPRVSYAGLGLKQGDTTRLHLGGYILGRSNIICAYTCSPNGIADSNPHNDYTCFTYTGITDVVMQNAAFNLYPNPASDKLLVSSALPFSGRYELINAQGKLIKSGMVSNVSECPFVLSGFANGIYLFKLQNEEGIQQFKFVVAH